MYIAVCDDNQNELEYISELLNIWQQKQKCTCHFKSFSNITEMLEAARKEKFTIYILDIMMPGINGINAAQEIRTFDTTADIVFLTSSKIFAYESYRVKALDYLLKPVDKDLLFSILDSVYQREQRPEDGLTVKSGTTLVRILFSQLSHVEVYHKNLYFNLTNGQVYKVFASLNDYKTVLLDRPEFIQIHRSYIVNMLHISEITQDSVITFSGKTLPVSRLRYSELQSGYMNLLFSQGEEY